ncbi:MAG: histidine kinase dimerization/phospho-acceptor domain-containing protein [Desulfuromonadales bacterium]
MKSLFDLDGNRKNLNSCLKDLQEEIDFLIHEIRTPLTAVSGSAQYLQENNLSREERNHWLATIRNEVRRINSLLDDFTRLNAPGSWLSSINFSALKIPDLLLEVIEVFQDSSPKHFIRVDVPPDLPSVCGDKGDQAAIFERSFRVYRPEGMRMRGAGLGLALVRRIVENHGGGVWVESLPGKGSTFSFSLPTGD